MKNTTKSIWLIIIFVIIGGVLFIKYEKASSPVVACTMEAKICPDGSSVGRTGPQCEFAACPGATSTAAVNKDDATLKGNITIGPVCPLDPQNKMCKPTPEMYAAAKVFVYLTDKKTLVTTITPDAKGTFSTSLAPRSYFIDMIHQTQGGTTGVPTIISLVAGGTKTLSLHVDTGLR